MDWQSAMIGFSGSIDFISGNLEMTSKVLTLRLSVLIILNNNGLTIW